jgi:hypothetical protein
MLARVLLYYTTTISVLVLTPLTLYTEMISIMSLYWSWELTVLMAAAALMSFLINIAMYLQINYTSPLINSFSGNFKVIWRKLRHFAGPYPDTGCCLLL